MKTINVDVSEGNHIVEITAPGFASYKVEIKVASSGVTCVPHGDPGWANCTGTNKPYMEVQDLWRTFYHLVVLTPGGSYTVEMNMPNGSSLFIDGNLAG